MQELLTLIKKRFLSPFRTNSSGAAMVELAASMIFFAAFLATLAIYLRTYLKYSEEAQVQQTMQLGRLAVIPAMSTVQSDGNNVLFGKEQIAAQVQLFLQRAYIAHDLTSGGAVCSGSNTGDWRGFIVSYPASTDCESAQPPDYSHITVYTCNSSITFNSSFIPEAIKQQADGFVGCDRSHIRHLFVAYSSSNPQLGATVVDTTITAFAAPSPSPTGSPVS